jgi:hypothetical protein
VRPQSQRFALQIVTGKGGLKYKARQVHETTVVVDGIDYAIIQYLSKVDLEGGRVLRNLERRSERHR